MKIENEQLAALEKRWFNLADASLGAEALFATDDFFAAKERMLNPDPAIWIDDKFDDHGKWMDGWETRRKRFEGSDYCIVRLGVPGIIKAINLDTSFFTGNFAPVASIEACYSCSEPTEESDWQELISPSALQGDTDNLFLLDSNTPWTHLKLNIFPDGGVARFRVYGEASCDWSERDATELTDLVAFENGGKVLECSDEHFGAMKNLIKPGRGINMGDGWETRRRREPGFDWTIMKLGHAGIIKKIEIDTAHFKGNFPHRVAIQAAYLPDDCDENMAPRSLFWKNLLPKQALEMDKEHTFEAEISELTPITHIRVDIHPDGGLSRVRLFGYPDSTK